jgi:cyclopropane fatty-acyl-phospholipid synthase-like methyltransferase
MYAQAESVMERLSPVRAEAMSRDQLVAEVEVLRARASQLQVRVEHLEEACEHYRRMNQHHRTEMERALARATREGMYRRLLAQEWAAAGRKVQMLSKCVAKLRALTELAK